MLRAAISARGAGGALTFHGYFLPIKITGLTWLTWFQGALAIFLVGRFDGVGARMGSGAISVPHLFSRPCLKGKCITLLTPSFPFHHLLYSFSEGCAVFKIYFKLFTSLFLFLRWKPISLPPPLHFRKDHIQNICKILILQPFTGKREMLNISPRYI